ncbi:MAG: hypothetical protein ACYDCH_05765 [Gaiellaceae bacterium]
MPRSRLEELEAAGLDARSPELLVVLAWLVAGEVAIPAAELNAARRRALLVLAAGGDPHRDVGHDDVAVRRLAAELDSPAARESLGAALARLDADGLPTISGALALLRDDADLAWQTLALALLADELADG